MIPPVNLVGDLHGHGRGQVLQTVDLGQGDVGAGLQAVHDGGEFCALEIGIFVNSHGVGFKSLGVEIIVHFDFLQIFGKDVLAVCLLLFAFVTLSCNGQTEERLE